MTTALDLCTLAWGERDGYVCLSVRNPKLKGQPGYWKDHTYKWPEETERVSRALEKARASKQDVYWAPAVFNGPKRDKNQVQELDVLWADLDEADPHTFTEELMPTAAWQTSPGRYQAIWKLDTEVSPESQTYFNKQLTYQVGADHGGWDLTQVLRIPGTQNHKYKDVEVKFEWLNGRVMGANVLARLAKVSEVPVTVAPVADLVDPAATIKKYALSAKAKQLLKARPTNATVGMRSERLWELECLLAEAGMSVVEIVSVVRPTAWNKFAGRHDELETLFREASKAQARAATNGSSVTAASSDGVTEQRASEEEVEVVSRPQAWGEFDRDHKPIRWLVEDIWGESEVGFISGMPKTYKTWLALDFAVSVATGTEFLGQFKSRKSNVLLIQEEDPRTVMQDRLVRIAAAKGHVWAKASGNTLDMLYDLPDNLYILSNGGFTITNPDNLEELATWIATLKIDLVVLDPLMMMAEGVDEFKAFDMMANVFKPLKVLRAATQASICVVHHHTKNGQASGGQAMYGSVALWAWEESALHLSLVSPGRVVAERFSKHASLMPLTIEMGNTEDRWAPTVMMGSGASTPELLELISMYSDGITFEELSASTGVGKDSLHRQLDALTEQGKLIKDKGTTLPNHRGRPPQVWRLV